MNGLRLLVCVYLIVISLVPCLLPLQLSQLPLPVPALVLGTVHFNVTFVASGIGFSKKILTSGDRLRSTHCREFLYLQLKVLNQNHQLLQDL